MNNLLPKLALVALPLFGFAGAAQALGPNAISHKYFDENGGLVGQDIRLCSGLSYHGGNTHTAYSITEETACGTNPGVDAIVPGTIVTAYTLPGFLPISTACGLAQCSGTGVAEPQRILNQGWVWTNP